MTLHTAVITKLSLPILRNALTELTCAICTSHTISATVHCFKEKLHQTLWRFQSLYMMLQAKGLCNVSYSSQLDAQNNLPGFSNDHTAKTNFVQSYLTELVSEQAPALKPKLRYHEIFKGHFLYNIKLLCKLPNT